MNRFKGFDLVDTVPKDLQDFLELTPTKDVLFIEDCNAKVRSQELRGVTGKFGLGVQNKADQRANTVWPRERTGHSKHSLPTTQDRLYTRTSPDGQYQNQIDYILCSQK